jgi:ABC-2 type transport system permease protein
VTGFIFRLTLHQLLWRKSTLLLAGLAALPVLLAVVFRLSDLGTEPERWTARVLMNGLVVTIVLPLTALLLGTTAIGDEIEDGTAVYLLTKPIPRWQILMPKAAAAWLLTCLIVLPTTVIAGVIALDGASYAIVWSFVAAIAAAALAYALVFVLLSVSTSRALIAGLLYVFLWEGVITGIFRGTRYLSIRHFSLGIADGLAGMDPSTFDAYVGGVTAMVAMAAVIVVAAVLATRRLETLEVREPG